MNPLQSLIDSLSKLPTLGVRSARRIVLHLLQDCQRFNKLIEQMHDVERSIIKCHICGNLDCNSPCSICLDYKRNKKIMCIVEGMGELWAMERGGAFRGSYHVLGGVLSALHDITPEKLNLSNLRARIRDEGVEEVVLAISATLDGQTTAFYISNMIAEDNIKISRLALGVPVGADLEYMDESTLSMAMEMRQKIWY